MIPLQYYTEIFINAIAIIILVVMFHTSTSTSSYGNSLFNRFGILIVLVFTILYMGLRPVSGAFFGDMVTYARKFEILAHGGTLPEKDVGFTVFISACAKVMSSDMFFLVCAALYVFPLYIAVKRWHKDYAFIALLACIGSSSFWSYGTNGIRAGLAASIFVCAMSYRKVIPVMIIFLLVSISVHKSMMLPLLAFGVTFIYNKPKSYLIGWFVAIVLSNLMGGFWENFFASLGFADDRFSDYLTNTENMDQFSRTGFRWDFLLYSSVAVVVGYLYIAKYKFMDKFYHQLYNTYVLSNAFWIMVIRAAFSNRFAYLSWFLMAPVIIYPLLKHKMFKFQYAKVGYALLIYYSFAYGMFYLL